MRHVIDSSCPTRQSHQAGRRQGEDSGMRPRTRRPTPLSVSGASLPHGHTGSLPTGHLLTLTLLLPKEMNLGSASSAKRGRRAGSVHRHVASVTSISRGRKTVQTDSPAPRPSGSFPSSKLELCARTLKMRQTERWTRRQGSFKATTYPSRSSPSR